MLSHHGAWITELRRRGTISSHESQIPTKPSSGYGWEGIRHRLSTFAEMVGFREREKDDVLVKALLLKKYNGYSQFLDEF